MTQTPSLTESPLTPQEQERLNRLEREVLRAQRAGLEPAAIARRLGLTPATVTNLLQIIAVKLEAARAEAPPDTTPDAPDGSPSAAARESGKPVRTCVDCGRPLRSRTGQRCPSCAVRKMHRDGKMSMHFTSERGRELRAKQVEQYRRLVALYGPVVGLHPKPAGPSGRKRGRPRRNPPAAGQE